MHVELKESQKVVENLCWSTTKIS